MKKNIKYIFVIIVIIGLVFVLAGYPKKVQAPVSNIPNTSVASLCYTWNTPVGDAASMRVNITTDNQVTGFFNYIPKEKDKKTGNFSGTIDPQQAQTTNQTIPVKLIWNASGEGITNNEELTVLLGANTAQPGFGEMVDNGTGVYIYAHPDQVSYNITLNRVDCGDTL